MAKEVSEKGIRVYWINSGPKQDVGSDVAVRFTKDRVEFADGGWNDLASTYLTATQARRAERIPEPIAKTTKAARRTIGLLNRAVTALEDALEAEPEEL